MNTGNLAVAWREVHELARRFIDLQGTNAGSGALTLREYKRGLFRGRTHRGWHLWTESHDSDAWGEPTDVYVLTNGSIARGSKPDAIDVITPDSRYSEDFQLRLLRHSADSLRKAIEARVGRRETAKLNAAAKGSRIDEVRWRRALDRRAGQLCSLSDTVFAVVFERPEDLIVKLYQVSDGIPVGSTSAADLGADPKAIRSVMACVASGQVVLVLTTDRDSEVLALRSPSGKVAWRRIFPSIKAPPAGGDLVVFSDMRGKVYALDPLTGAEQWTSKLPAMQLVREATYFEPMQIRPTRGTSQAFVSSAGQVLLHHLEWGVVCLDHSNGKTRWQIAGDASLDCAPFASGDVVLSINSIGQISALNASSGDVRWRCSLGGSIASLPTVCDGTAYVVTREDGRRRLAGEKLEPSTISAVSLDSGSIRWRNSFNGGSLEPPRSPVVVADRVYASHAVFSASSGQKLVQRDEIYASSMVASPAGVLIQFGAELTCRL